MTLNQTQKIALYVGGGVAVLGTILSGVAINNHVQAERAKKAAELAYANRPIVTEECVMNGFGEGSCKFTNTGKTGGAKCGVIQVQGPGVAESGKFCSGMVATMSTEKVEFDIPAVNELCDNGFESWTEKCSFTFISDGSGKPN